MLSPSATLGFAGRESAGRGMDKGLRLGRRGRKRAVGAVVSMGRGNQQAGDGKEEDYAGACGVVCSWVPSGCSLERPSLANWGPWSEGGGHSLAEATDIPAKLPNSLRMCRAIAHEGLVRAPAVGSTHVLRRRFGRAARAEDWYAGRTRRKPPNRPAWWTPVLQ